MTLEHLRELAERLPDGAALSLPRDLLLDLLNGVAVAAEPATDDLTVAQVAERLHRKASTIRGWCQEGRFTGVYKLNGRDWRVPPASVEAFLNGQRPQPAPVDLGAWRRQRRVSGSRSDR